MRRIKERMTGVMHDIELARAEISEQLCLRRLRTAALRQTNAGNILDNFPESIAFRFRARQIAGGIGHQQNIERCTDDPFFEPFRDGKVSVEILSRQATGDGGTPIVDLERL